MTAMNGAAVKAFCSRWPLDGFIAALAVFGMACAQASPYPSKPVTVMVGFSAGGAADILARLITQRLSLATGQPFIVVDKPGAGGTIASTLVAAAPADGHTLLFVTSGFAGSGALYQKLRYDPLKSFAPVAQVGSSPVLIVVAARSPFLDVSDLTQAARLRPGQLNYAGGGGGATVTNLAAEYFRDGTKIDMMRIPYEGSGPALMGLLMGEVDVAFDTPSSALPHINRGDLRALAVTSSHRVSILPDVPTVAERGVASLEILAWFGVLAPAATPPGIVAQLNKEINAILHQPDLRKQLLALGVEPGGGSPADFAALIAAETSRSGKAIRRLGIKVD